ncbi:hypothetical protein QJS10_CPB11g00360 [Acorus calamus]|uniref:Uncharacterized protein n=1 Tax=Acorus calamus TaxID=4465 RepID=A0AAV9DRK6_ACOCL|nr:hypothetical protein QJS10_CPB11g00360 [Acorus calamus]
MASSSVCLTANGLSTCSSKQNLKKEIYGRHVASSSGIPSLAILSRPISVKASLEQKVHEGRRGFLKLFLGNVGLGLPALVGAKNAYADDESVSSSRMSYSRFLEYLDKDRVTKVDLYENGTIAIVEAISPSWVTGCSVYVCNFQDSARSSFRNLERRILILLHTVPKKTRETYCST